MARIRTIKPEFYSDPDLGRLSLEARYLYVGSWLFADDTGRMPADPRLLKSQVFPYDDKITVAKVEKLIEELAEAGKAARYEVDGIHYLLLPRFLNHQRINRPQSPKYPPPPDGTFTEHSANRPGQRTPLSDPKGTDTTPTPTPGGGVGDENALKAALLDESWEELDVDAALRQWRVRQQFGDPVKDPLPWFRSLLGRMETARATADFTTSGSAVARLEDGTAMEFVDGEWREVVGS